MAEKDLREIISEIEKSDFWKRLKLRVLSIAEGFCELRLPITGNTVEPWGIISCNVFSSACTFAAFIAACTMIPKGMIPVIMRNDISLMMSVNEGELNVSSRIINLNENICFAKVNVSDQNKCLVACSQILIEITGQAS